jgi:hypothetical protein
MEEVWGAGLPFVCREFTLCPSGGTRFPPLPRYPHISLFLSSPSLAPRPPRRTFCRQDHHLSRGARRPARLPRASLPLVVPKSFAPFPSLLEMEIKPRADLDIFPKLAAYLDPHLVIPVLESEFYRGLGVRLMQAARARPAAVPSTTRRQFHALPFPLTRARADLRREGCAQGQAAGRPQDLDAGVRDRHLPGAQRRGRAHPCGCVLPKCPARAFFGPATFARARAPPSLTPRAPPSLSLPQTSSGCTTP